MGRASPEAPEVLFCPPGEIFSLLHWMGNRAGVAGWLVSDTVEIRERRCELPMWLRPKTLPVHRTLTGQGPFLAPLKQQQQRLLCLLCGLLPVANCVGCFSANWGLSSVHCTQCHTDECLPGGQTLCACCKQLQVLKGRVCSESNQVGRPGEKDGDRRLQMMPSAV